MCFAALVFALCARPLPAQTPDEPAAQTNLRSVLRAEAQRSLATVRRYAMENSSAPDINRAYTWLFKTAQEHRLQSELIDIAATCLKQSDGRADSSLQRDARQVLMAGLLQTGKTDDAFEILSQQLQAARFRDSNSSLDFGKVMAAEAQAVGKPEVALQVYERLTTAFILNPTARDVCDDRLLKLELISRAAPPIETTTLDGEPFDLATLTGKVVLIDFWATNCAPCLEEFPNLRQIYADHHAAGFEIVGISLDDSPTVVEAFVKQWKLPWRQVVDKSTVPSLRKAYRVPTIPSLFLLDRSGKVVAVDVNGEALRAVIENLLNHKP